MLARLNPSAQEGFVLPLALTGALVLLLSSLSLHATLLHARRVQAAERHQLLLADQLASAAHKLAGALEGRFACLRELPSDRWGGTSAAAACPADLDPSQLLSFAIAGGEVRLIRWTPLDEGGQFELQLADQGAGTRRQFAWGRSGLRELG